MNQKKRYTIAELFGVEGLYLYGHPGKQELSSGLFCYDLKENRFKKEQVGKKVTEDYGGAILLPIPIPFGNREMLGVKEEFEISCKSCKYITLQEYMDKASRMSHEKIVQTMEGGIYHANEELIYMDPSDQYEVFQIYYSHASGEGYRYRFRDMSYVHDLDLKVHGANYRIVSGGKLLPGETVDSLSKRISRQHLIRNRGHAISISDVIMIKKSGKIKSYYVDSNGFWELPLFKRQRINENRFEMIEGFPKQYRKSKKSRQKER